ncbi:GIY-YIG nuclease family protein [Haloterrigena alkaliphila]|uniref:GIY-YIG nuclease family protein n=1 Tax=Haloterrigena alkaliphila TaxID=2816475 RepID=A0A8A2VAA5_9EURY|nr:GIY-YIG nuclease family protein [Haloterrigena alkaliphila]QSW97650.1 GIY-YIG nuclease family protein [Haloterrigena alkaliphila]
MADFREEYYDFNPHFTEIDDVLEELDALLGDRYDCSYETSLKDEFLIACFERIDPTQDWRTLVKTKETYDDSWNAKKKRATALHMLMTKQIGWPLHKALLDFERKYIVGIILTIKASDQGIRRHYDHVPTTLPPDIDPSDLENELPERTVPDQPFPTLCRFSRTIESDTAALLKERGINPAPGNHHIVYVVDCTPAPDAERKAITAIRRYTQAKHINGYQPADERESAAVFLNESKGLFYVGRSDQFPQRMQQHYEGRASGGARFTNLYKPRRLLEVTDFETRAEAETDEQRRAYRLQMKTERYVSQN